jgi:uncharacterized iron-regulated protein
VLIRYVLLLLAVPAVLTAQSGYVPHRVYDSDHKRFVDFESMLADLVKADVVFVGEQHDDPNTHRLELAILEGLGRRRSGIIVSLEMFERDAQEPLEHFLLGHSTEEEFLKISRPWPRYATDYKPLVEFAISKDWHVVAANVPRPIASEVSKSGFGALESRPEAERKWFARERQCPTDDDYFKRFSQAMNEHPGAPASSETAKRQMTERFYLSQCLKDETMAESIAQAHAAASAGGQRPLVVHFNGAFHSDFGQGTASRAKRRLPGKRVVVVSVLPVKDLDGLSPDGSERRRAEYLVYTTRDPGGRFTFLANQKTPN